ncbi:MAG TPA: 3-dehydro-L-gulonate 2-dehydrogenase [Terracidiphilus sp.]|jgi:3-dehydro-L-gulonate 2-dehydrogenase|nr:3-dehydro-L-gulonate 2-dehydrogenase [Terracidiphilus sp.]
MNRFPIEQVRQTLAGVLVRFGMAGERAETCARLFAEATRDGVYTHGVNRFPRFVDTIRNGSVKIKAAAQRVAGFGALERWDGNHGPGNLNALAAMDRAIGLGREHGIGCVSLGNTNHWMRAGAYGWQAADAGMIGICWTNTMPNLPPWGGLDPVLGNNPLVFAVPRAKGHVVLDMAMSQFSYGTLESYRKRGEQLPVEGGFDEAGNLTRDPGAIEKSWRPLPVGYWKGSGLAIVLDMIAAVMALGQATHQLAPDPLLEVGISQIFLTMNPQALGTTARADQIADEIVDSLHNARPVAEGERVRYPGEQTLRVRAENEKLGLPVEPAVWEQILAM